MRARVQKWGNSLAVRIPQAFAAELHLAPDIEVELTLDDGSLALTPVVRDAPTLEALLAGVTDDNLHTPMETDPAVGVEVW